MTTGALDPVAGVLAPEALVATALLGVRLTAVLAVAPMYSAATVPVRVRAAVLLLLVLVLQPVARAHVASGAALTPAAAAAEALVGLAIGFGAALVVGAAQTAGELMTMQMGLSGAAVVDPMTRISVPVLGQFVHLLALTLLLAADAHLAILDAVVVTLRQLPLGGAVHAREGLRALLGLGTALFADGVRLAAPVMAAILVANVALAVLSRAAPQLNVLSVAFPLQIGLGLFVLGAALPVIAGSLAGWSRSYDVVLGRLVGTLATGAR